MSDTAIAAQLGVTSAYVAKWRDGNRPSRMGADLHRRLDVMVRGLEEPPETGRYPLIDPKPLVIREQLAAPSLAGEWPEGWRVRFYRLQLEAGEAGATEDEIAVVKGFMLNPELQALWAGGAPKDLSELEGIELGARAWLRARGRKVKAK